MLETILYLLLLQLLAFAAGASGVAVFLLAARRPRNWVSYALTKVGLIGTSTILFIAVAPQGEIEVSWRSAGYLASLAITCAGLVGVSRDVARTAGRRSAFGRPKGVPLLDDDKEVP